MTRVTYMTRLYLHDLGDLVGSSLSVVKPLARARFLLAKNPPNASLLYTASHFMKD